MEKFGVGGGKSAKRYTSASIALIIATLSPIIIALPPAMRLLLFNLLVICAVVGLRLLSKRVGEASVPRGALTVLSATVLATLLVTQASAAVMVEWVLPPGSYVPYDIAVDSYGGVWFTEFSKIGKLDPSSNTFSMLSLAAFSRPWGILWDGRNNRIYFSESGANRIGMIEYGGAVCEFSTIPGPRGIAIQQNETKTLVWVASYQGDLIARLDVTTPSSVQMVTWKLWPASGPQSILYDPSTGVWFTECGRDGGGRIGNLIPELNLLREWTLQYNGRPWDIVIDRMGYIWFTDPGRNSICRLNPYTNLITEFPLPTYNSQPYGIIVDSANRIWFVENTANKIGRYSIADNTLIELSRPPGGAPWDAVWDATRSLIWLTDAGLNRICRLDPSLGITTSVTPTLSTALSYLYTTTGAATSYTTPPALTTSTGSMSYTFATSSATATPPTTTYTATETSMVTQITIPTTTPTMTPTTVTTQVITTSTILTTTLTTTVYVAQTTYVQTAYFTSSLTRTTTVLATLTSTSLALVTTLAGPVPGFSAESTITGLGLGVLALVALRKRRRR